MEALGSFLPLILIGLFVYFLMIRPQRQRQKAFAEMQRSLSPGDDVVTIGGLHGRVDAVGEDFLDLQVTDDVVLRFKRSAVAEIVRDEPEAEAIEGDDEDEDEE